MESQKADNLAALTPLCGEIRDAEHAICDIKLSINSVFAQIGQLKVSESTDPENMELVAKITSAQEEVARHSCFEHKQKMNYNH
jgi:hypothetical protein